jgi:phosphatidylglycerol:prolipoprotein diacylglycerol transferase
MYPRLLHIYGPLYIQSYGTLIAIGFLIFLFLTYKSPIREKIISGEKYLNVLFIGLLSGIIGGRILFVLNDLEYFINSPQEIFYLWQGGFVVLGSVIGVLAGVSVYLYKNNINILALFDLASLYAPLLLATSRLGCLCAGCCYGAPAPTLSWAIIFHRPEGFAPIGVYLHPTQIYFSLSYLIIFILFILVSKFKSLKLGQLTFLYLISENIIRFTLDFWRGDRGKIYSLGLSHQQYLSILFFSLSFIGFIIVSLKDKK